MTVNSAIEIMEGISVDPGPGRNALEIKSPLDGIKHANRYQFSNKVICHSNKNKTRRQKEVQNKIVFTS